MLVEDDNNLREIYGERLLAEGYEIVSACDGEEALALAVKEKPDLIISDVMMPKISGFDMLDILRQTPETKNTQVIMMTALSQAEDKERADKLGADKYLVKSQVTLEDVARVVHDMLYGPEPAAVAETPEQAAPVAMALSQPPEVAAEPTTAVTQPVTVEPTVVAAPAVAEPVAAAPVPEPMAPVITPAEPAVTPEPPVASVIEPITFSPPTPTPAPAPEPVTTAPEPPVTVDPVTVIEPTATDQSAVAVPEPVVIVEPILGTPAPAEPSAEPVEAPSAIIDTPTASTEPEQATSVQMPDDTADLASEQAEVNEKINSFANTEPAEPVVHTEPLVEPTAVEPQVSVVAPEPAADDSTVVTPTVGARELAQEPTNQDSEEPLPANIPRPMDTNVAESASTRKKVIEPIGSPTDQPNINDLYEKEMAAEAANVPVANPPTGAILGAVDTVVQPAVPVEEPKDPNNATTYAL
jgi:CheY-like chemotaxis protein